MVAPRPPRAAGAQGDPDLELVELVVIDGDNVLHAVRGSRDAGGVAWLLPRLRMWRPSGLSIIVALDGPADRWASLGEGYRVEASILVWSGSDVVTVPASAPFRYGGDWAVYAVEQGRAHMVPIRVGHRTDALVEVRSGLRVADRVIAYPGEQIRDGARVRERS